MRKIEVSSRTIIFTVFFLLALKFLWVIKDLIFSLFIAFIIMSALKPFVNWMVNKKIPRAISAIITYFVFVGFFFSTLLLAFPPLIKESTMLVKNFPFTLKDFPVASMVNMDLSQHIPNLTNQFFDLVGGIFSNTIFTISTLFFAFYFILQENTIEGMLTKFFDEDRARQIAHVFEKAEERMSAWFWGEITLMTIVGLMTFVGLNLIGIKYALPLAVLAGLLEVVPNLGPTISAVPAALIGLSQSYFLAFAAIALSFLIQQLENNLVVPVVMKKAVGLNPIITLIALIIGGKLAGVLGVLLAIPTTLFIETVLIELLKTKKSTENLR